MRFVHDSVPNITVIKHNDPRFEITSVTYFDEQKDRVILKCAEYVEDFQRGFTCDLITEYHTCDETEDNEEKISDIIIDLVLVYVNKSWDVNKEPIFEYVFYK